MEPPSAAFNPEVEVAGAASLCLTSGELGCGHAIASKAPSLLCRDPALALLLMNLKRYYFNEELCIYYFYIFILQTFFQKYQNMNVDDKHPQPL